MVTDRVAAAREAFSRQDWKKAYADLSVADEARAEIAVEDLERLAISAYMLGKDEASADFWARPHAESMRQHDARRAARCAFWLLDLLTSGEDARAGGWLARGKHALDERPDGAVSRGMSRASCGAAAVGWGMAAGDRVRHRSLDDEALLPPVYVSAFRSPSRPMILVIRSQRLDAEVLAVVREETARLDVHRLSPHWTISATGGSRGLNRRLLSFLGEPAVPDGIDRASRK
jgi:hypothetical protein